MTRAGPHRFPSENGTKVPTSGSLGTNGVQALPAGATLTASPTQRGNAAVRRPSRRRDIGWHVGWEEHVDIDDLDRPPDGYAPAPSRRGSRVSEWRWLAVAIIAFVAFSLAFAFLGETTALLTGAVVATGASALVVGPLLGERGRGGLGAWTCLLVVLVLAAS